MIRRAGTAALWMAVLAWAGLLFWESSQSNPFPFVPSAILAHDKILHAGAYAVLGALLLAAIVRARVAARAIVLAALIATAYGATDEWHQSYVPNRDADPFDLGADALGALAGAAATAVILRRRMVRASIRA